MKVIEDVDPPIYGLVIDDAQLAVGSVFISESGVTSIEPYREQDGSLWFTVWMGDELTRRVNGRFVVEVSYSQGE